MANFPTLKQFLLFEHVVSIDCFTKKADSVSELGHENPNDPQFLDWKRLQLSKAKLSGITDM
jgi:hypothetical protein